MGKKGVIRSRTSGVAEENASKGVIKSLKALFQSDTSRNAQAAARPRVQQRTTGTCSPWESFRYPPTVTLTGLLHWPTRESPTRKIPR
jgi:hypothetical protein